MIPTGKLKRWLKWIPGVSEAYRRTSARLARARIRLEGMAAGDFGRRPEILFFPHTPSPKSVAFKVCRRLGYPIAGRERPEVILAVRYEYATFKTTTDSPGHPDGAPRPINSTVREISKTHVDEVMRETFGYGLIVDPASHSGPMVRKSNLNGRHDGEVVEGPLSFEDVEASSVYQRVVDNRCGADLVRDIRVPVVHDLLSFVYLKDRPLDDRFSNRNLHADLAPIEEVFEPSERQRILQFAKRIGLDFGELDVLRDAESGRIFIVDVNDTPNGPPNHISEAAGREAIEAIAQRFETCFVRSIADAE